MVKARAQNKEDKCKYLQQRIYLVDRFVEARKVCICPRSSAPGLMGCHKAASTLCHDPRRGVYPDREDGPERDGQNRVPAARAAGRGVCRSGTPS
jgi:hypothetical protein